MALPVIADTYRVAFISEEIAGPSSAVNVMHFRKDAGTADGLGISLLAHFDSDMYASASNLCQLSRWEITPLDGTSGTTIVDANIQYQSGGEFVPQVAVIAKLKTGQRGGAKRGRVFIPFTQEGHIANGRLEESLRLTMEGAWESFVSAMDYELVIASYKYGFATSVGDVDVEPVLATQRRRQDRLRS